MSDLNERAQSLIKSARTIEVAPSLVAKTRMRRALVAGLALPAAAAASTSLLKLVVVAVVSAAIGSGATLLLTRTPAPPPPLALVTAPPPPTTTTTPEPEVAPPTPPPPRAVRTAKPTVTEPQPVAEPPRPELPPEPTPMTPDESLAAELHALDVVLADLDAQRFAEAEIALRVFHSRFPKAELAVEATSLEVRALCGLQRTDAARSLAERLLTEHPMNPSVQRLRNTCGAK